MTTDFRIESPTLEHIVQRLANEAGIDPESLEPRRIAWTVQRRCRTLGLPDALAYVAQLESSASELDYLIDALLIQETRFFRDPPVFDNLRRWAEEMAAIGPAHLRILSAPCSTGQEAYSLAAVLHSSGIPFTRFSIDAFDISPTALAVARRGVYSAGMLDHVPVALQTACGTLRDQHWQMREQLRGCIRFERRNLARPDALRTESGYHLIFCRNLMIYLGAKARADLAKMLSEALLPGGVLVMGAGDRVAEVNALFDPLKPASGFGLTHKVSKTRAAEPAPAQPIKQRAPRRHVGNLRPEIAVAPTSAAEFYRRAVDCLERGNARQAERRCRQALYLAPGYLPALEMLQTLWHLHPNARIKRALTSRIQRVRAESRIAARELPEGGTK